MNTFIADERAVEILSQLHEVTTILDADGRIMGYFTPKEKLVLQEMKAGHDQPSQENAQTTTDDM